MIVQTERWRSPIELAKVASVYSGKNNSCCCGCSGKYSYATVFQEWASKNRGYTVNPEEINDREVQRIVGKINRALASEEVFEGSVGAEYAHLVVGNRLYMARFYIPE